jgi:hypothetical protein
MPLQGWLLLTARSELGPTVSLQPYPLGDLGICGDGAVIPGVDACGVEVETVGTSGDVDIDIASPGTCAWKEVVGSGWDPPTVTGGDWRNRSGLRK